MKSADNFFDKHRMCGVLLLLVCVEDLFSRFCSLYAVRLFGAADDIFLLHSIIDTSVPERGATCLVDAQATPQVSDRLLAVERFLSQSKPLDPVSNCV